MSKRFMTLLLASALACGTVEPANALFVTRKAPITATTTAIGTVAALPSQDFTAPAARLHKKSTFQKKRSVLQRFAKHFKNKLVLTSKVLAAVLAFFLGLYGVHRFYLGYKKQGFMQLGGTLLGLALYLAAFVTGVHALFYLGYVIILAVGIWAFVDFIRILTGGLEPENGSYD